MRFEPVKAEPFTPAEVLDGGDVAKLQAEIARLQRENRALAIALSEMERVAERDMLTPLFNRRHFLSAMHQRIARVHRYGDRIALLYVDVDGLKAINDQFGHAAGDFALIEIATRLASAIRQGDVLARIGGDEFGILLEKMSANAARLMANRMARHIAQEPCHFEGQIINLGASFGVATIETDDSAEALLGRADAAMYSAKRLG